MLSDRIEEWKNRKDLHDIIQNNPKFYNSWRSVKFTKKGKKIGYTKEFDSFATFYESMYDSYTNGYVLSRIDKDLPFSKGNCIWTDKTMACVMRRNSVYVEYDGIRLTLREWASRLQVTFASLRCRYYHHPEWSSKEILFGKEKKRNSKSVTDWKNNPSKLRSKASKMIASYKCKDKKLGIDQCDMNIEWMIENIITQSCVYCKDTKRIGADRIDNSKGHTKENVVPCCYECNCARNNNFTYDEMKIIGETIRKVKDNRNK